MFPQSVVSSTSSVSSGESVMPGADVYKHSSVVGWGARVHRQAGHHFRTPSEDVYQVSPHSDS